MKQVLPQLGFPCDVKVRHLRAPASRSLRLKEPLENLIFYWFYALSMRALEFTLISDPIHQRKKNTGSNKC